MGAERPEEQSFSMNIELIGKDLGNFLENISKARTKYSIQNYWKFNYVNRDIKEIINEYFNKLLEISKGENKTIEFKECLLVKVENITDPEVDLIIGYMDRLREVHYMPLVLLMAVNYAENSQLKL